MAGAEEIIEDYASSLEWLQTNDRYAINNFTVIAKENTEHADAISQVLVDHIAKAHPNHKLPALYVLDSIAKNVGTPYTLFLGHRLYNAFMGAYSLVDNGVRKKLDEMLKTWKQPIPGSLDSRPVFDANITKRIENALIQAKTRTLQSEQRQQREQQELLRRRIPGSASLGQWRNTPTPPQNGAQFPVPSSQGFIRYDNANTPPSTHSPYPSNSYSVLQLPQNQYQNSAGVLPSRPTQASFTDLNVLEKDVQVLIEKFRDLVVRNYNDTGLQTKLKALQDLQMLLKSQDLPPDQLQAVRAQVDSLQVSQASAAQSSASMLPMVSVTNYPSAGIPAQSSYQAQYQPPYQPHPHIPQQAPYPPSTTPNSSLPSADFLAKLLAGRSNTPHNAPLTSQFNEIQKPPPAPTAPTTSTAENPLLAQLRAAGLLSSSTTPDMSPATQDQATPAHVTIPSLANLSALLRPSLKEKINDIELTSASLKIPRPQMIEKLYGEQPNQCLTCGKRFLSNENGKAQKARHMDWHFRTNQRLGEAAIRGQSRSWYVDEMEWIKFKDGGDSTSTQGRQGIDETSHGSGMAARNDPRSKFIRVPSENDLPCGICQEKFVTSWNEELQDFVWIDAVKVGDKIYHASCYEDFKKDGGNTPGRIATPDSVLGKRKADNGSNNPSPAKRIVSEI